MAFNAAGDKSILAGGQSHFYMGNTAIAIKTPQVFTGKIVDISFNSQSIEIVDQYYFIGTLKELVERGINSLT